MDSLFFLFARFLLTLYKDQQFIATGWMSFFIKTSFKEIVNKLQAGQQKTPSLANGE